MAPAPKPLPKPNPQQVTSTQATKQQAQQHQQLAQHLHKELMKPNPQQRIYPQPPTPIQKPVTAPFQDHKSDEKCVIGSKAWFLGRKHSAFLNRNRGLDRHSVDGFFWL
jgi:predicted extracellular nuclease